MLKSFLEQETNATMKIPVKNFELRLESLPIKGYEQVVRIIEPRVGLNAIIAIHSTVLGPALGGTRIYPYNSITSALDDVLRLAKGMTYKTAIAEVGLGGGKSVILAHPKQKNEELLLAFGAAVHELQGRYICAEDMGSTVEDCRTIRRMTPYVVGLPHARSSGDPAPFTAWGTFRGMQAAANWLFGSDDLEGKTVAIQGVGSVGALLAHHLFWAGAKLLLADVNTEKARQLANQLGAVVVPPDQILRAECDILAPCAMGGVIHDETIPYLRCRAIVGCANNQLLRDDHSQALRARGILYAPDFMVNAGGVLNVTAELDEEGYHPAIPRQKVHRIYDGLSSIFEIAEKNQESTHAAALALAEYRLRYEIGKRQGAPFFPLIQE